jgi:hypothetical protein
LHRIALPKKPDISGISLSLFAGKDSDKFLAIATDSAAGYGLKITRGLPGRLFGQIIRADYSGRLFGQIIRENCLGRL